MNLTTNNTDGAPVDCIRTRRWLSGEADDTSSEDVESHLDKCPECLAFAERLDATLPPIRMEAARRENEALEAPQLLRDVVTTEINRQSLAPSRPQLRGRFGSLHRTSPTSRRLVATACAAVVITVWWMWPAEPPVSLTRSTPPLGAPNQDQNALTDSSQGNETMNSENDSTSASVIAADGYLVVAESIEDDEIPFVWVLPQTQR